MTKDIGTYIDTQLGHCQKWTARFLTRRFWDQIHEDFQRQPHWRLPFVVQPAVAEGSHITTSRAIPGLKLECTISADGTASWWILDNWSFALVQFVSFG